MQYLLMQYMQTLCYKESIIQGDKKRRKNREEILLLARTLAVRKIGKCGGTTKKGDIGIRNKQEEYYSIEGRTIIRREGARAGSLGDKSRAKRAFDDHLGQAAREMPRERPRKKV